MQHDGEKKRIQGDAGQQERPCGEKTGGEEGKTITKGSNTKDG